MKQKYKPKKKLLYVGTKKQMEKMKKRLCGFHLPKKNYLIKKYYSKWGLYRKLK